MFDVVDPKCIKKRDVAICALCKVKIVDLAGDSLFGGDCWDLGRTNVRGRLLGV